MNELMNLTTLKTDLSSAALGGYIRDIDVNPDWISYRNPDYPLTSASCAEQRFNTSGCSGYYIASGDYVGQLEVLNHFERVKCNVTAHTVKVFDLYQFSVDYGYTDAFVQQRDSGGWYICQQVSDFLTTTFSITGILYQSAALHQFGEVGCCIAILPGREQQLSVDFFISCSTVADVGFVKA
jgi:hypothetical protein